MTPLFVVTIFDTPNCCVCFLTPPFVASIFGDTPICCEYFVTPLLVVSIFVTPLLVLIIFVTSLLVVGIFCGTPNCFECFLTPEFSFC